MFVPAIVSKGTSSGPPVVTLITIHRTSQFHSGPRMKIFIIRSKGRQKIKKYQIIRNKTRAAYPFAEGTKVVLVLDECGITGMPCPPDAPAEESGSSSDKADCQRF